MAITRILDETMDGFAMTTSKDANISREIVEIVDRNEESAQALKLREEYFVPKKREIIGLDPDAIIVPGLIGAILEGHLKYEDDIIDDVHFDRDDKLIETNNREPLVVNKPRFETEIRDPKIMPKPPKDDDEDDFDADLQYGNALGNLTSVVSKNIFSPVLLLGVAFGLFLIFKK